MPINSHNGEPSVKWPYPLKYNEKIGAIVAQSGETLLFFNAEMPCNLMCDLGNAFIAALNTQAMREGKM